MAKLQGTFTPDNASISNEHLKSTPPIDADKLQHIHVGATAFGFAIGGTPTTREEIVYVAQVDGVVRNFSALLNDTGTSTDIDFDLKKNGTTILSAVVTITDATSDRAAVDATISSASYSAGDVFSIAMTVTSSTGAQGPFASADFEENGAVA